MLIPEASTDGIVSLELQDEIYILSMLEYENRWNLDFTEAIYLALEYVKNNNDGHVLITRSMSKKFFSNGLDITWLMNAKSNNENEKLNRLTEILMPCFAKVIELPIPTIALINGHCFGAGFMFALAHDFRIQNKDKGFLCANEIQIGMTIPLPELSLFKHAMSPPAFFKTVLDAHRWNAKEAYQNHIVHGIYSKEDIMRKGIEFAKKRIELGKNRQVFHEMKKNTKGYIADEIYQWVNENLKTNNLRNINLKPKL